jgi:5-methylthioribose kinase
MNKIKDTIRNALNKIDNDEEWSYECEFAGGNMNYTFLYKSLNNQRFVIAKMAPPYVKCMGESWPMASQRILFEARTCELYNEIVPELVPELLYFDENESVLLMEYIPQNDTLRDYLIHKLINDQTMLTIALMDVAQFMGKTLFYTSDFNQNLTQKMKSMSFYSNNYEVCELTDKVIFTEPYDPDCSNNNQWVKQTPAVNDYVLKNIQCNEPLKREVSKLRFKFRSCPQALIHGDLHTGSVLVSPTYSKKTVIIDGEFSFYGPIGFDVGKFIGNLLISACSHMNSKSISLLLLDQIQQVWNIFVETFTRTNNTPEMDEFIQSIFQDTKGYAACSMIRRVIGVANCPDVSTILDHSYRAQVVITILDIAQELVCKNIIVDMDSLLEICRSRLYSD